MQTADTYNRGGFYAFLFSVVFSLIFFIYVALIHPGVDLKEIPKEAVAALGTAAPEGTSAAVDLAKVQKPWEPKDEIAQAGAAIFKQNCGACHGDNGMGDGPAGASLQPPPRNLVEGKWKQGGDSVALFKTLQTGIPGGSMVGFKSSLKPYERWALVQFIRSITKNKVADQAAQLEAFGATAD